MGGDCLNTGCVPSKSLIAAGKHAHAIARGCLRRVGAVLHVDFGKVHAHVHGVIAAIAPNDSKERFAGLGVQVIQGTARFKDRKTVVVGNGIEIRARRFVVATGSSPALPAIPGLGASRYLTNETVFNLSTRPDHLIVIGAGPVGLSRAGVSQAWRCGHGPGGSTAIGAGGCRMRRGGARRCCARALTSATTSRSRASRPSAGSCGLKIKVTVRRGDAEQTVEGSHLLVATGRRANVDGLGLEQAGIKREAGGICVDERLRTANKRVYAIGDVVGAGQFTHLANYHAGLVIRNALFRQRAEVNEDVIPRVTFTDPELAHVGLTEAEARARRIKLRVLRWPYHENDRAQAERVTAGHIKVVTDRRGKVLGATIVGAAAGEMITAWTLAISEGLDIRAFPVS